MGVINVIVSFSRGFFEISLQNIDNKGFTVCMKELHFKSVYDPVSITWVTMPGNLPSSSQVYLTCLFMIHDYSLSIAKKKTTGTQVRRDRAVNRGNNSQWLYTIAIRYISAHTQTLVISVEK